jgi:hypothetical protein
MSEVLRMRCTGEGACSGEDSMEGTGKGGGEGADKGGGVVVF